MESKVNINKIEKLINELLPGLTMFVRDVNLPSEIVEKYEVGSIIREKAFVDASSRVMGMCTTHRYSILSNHMTDLSGLEQGTDWGICIAKQDSHFKILDVYEYEGKTQILLLHLPDDCRWRLFESAQFNIESDIVEDSRKRFEQKCLLDPVPALATDEWQRRCSFPIGIDDNGNPYDLYPDLKEVSVNADNVSFREFYNHVIFATLPDACMESVKEGIGGSEEDDHALLVGYIDEECGVSFHVLCSGRIEGNHIVVSERDWTVGSIIRFESIQHQYFVPFKYIDIDLEPYEDYIQTIVENYETDNDDKLKMRGMRYFDRFRNSAFPDDLQVVLFKDEIAPEAVWVRCTALGENSFYGTLLNEPLSDFGVHEGDLIEFVAYQKDNEELLLVSIIGDNNKHMN